MHTFWQIHLAELVESLTILGSRLWECVSVSPDYLSVRLSCDLKYGGEVTKCMKRTHSPAEVQLSHRQEKLHAQVAFDAFASLMNILQAWSMSLLMAGVVLASLLCKGNFEFDLDQMRSHIVASSIRWLSGFCKKTKFWRAIWQELSATLLFVCEQRVWVQTALCSS